MAARLNQPNHNDETCRTRKPRRIQSHASSKDVMSLFPSIYFCPGENVTAQPKSAETSAEIATDHKTVPFMATLRQRAAGGLPELLTLPELCAFLKVKPHYIYSLTSTDRIPYRKFAGTLRFVKTEILEWLDRGRRGPRMSGPAGSES